MHSAGSMRRTGFFQSGLRDRLAIRSVRPLLAWAELSFAHGIPHSPQFFGLKQG